MTDRALHLEYRTPRTRQLRSRRLRPRTALVLYLLAGAMACFAFGSFLALCWHVNRALNHRGIFWTTPERQEFSGSYFISTVRMFCMAWLAYVVLNFLMAIAFALAAFRLGKGGRRWVWVSMGSAFFVALAHVSKIFVNADERMRYWTMEYEYSYLAINVAITALALGAIVMMLFVLFGKAAQDSIPAIKG